MAFEYLKCNFSVKNIFPKVPSRGFIVKNVEKLKCSKVFLVGTLSLCLKMPDSIKISITIILLKIKHLVLALKQHNLVEHCCWVVA